MRGFGWVEIFSAPGNAIGSYHSTRRNPEADLGTIVAEYESGVGFVSKHPNQKLIVVEDDAVVAGALMALLRNEGYDPVVFHNGQPALTYLRENNADAALIDIHLPDISGLDLSHRVREMKGQSLPIFILSGDNGMETLRALPQAGATYFFSKPVNTSHLLDQIRACF